jgi:hypothetical protein
MDRVFLDTAYLRVFLPFFFDPNASCFTSEIKSQKIKEKIRANPPDPKIRVLFFSLGELH